jgi:hypothetical protein
VDASFTRCIVTAISIMTNTGRRLHGFDAGIGEVLFAEYLRMLTLFAESLSIHRARVILPILYEDLRNTGLFDPFAGLFEGFRESRGFKKICSE